MKTARPLLVLLAVFVLCLSNAASIPDDPITPYDESEPLPYEHAPLPVSSLFAFRERVAEPGPRPRVFSEGRSVIGLIRSFGGRREQQERIVHKSLVILDHSLRC